MSLWHGGISSRLLACDRGGDEVFYPRGPGFWRVVIWDVSPLRIDRIVADFRGEGRDDGTSI